MWSPCATTAQGIPPAPRSSGGCSLARFAAMLRSAWIGYANAAMREHAVLGPWGAEGSFPRLSVEPQQG